MINVALNFNKK